MSKRRKVSLATFSHRRLSSPRSIRLLTLLPSTAFDAALAITLFEINLDGCLKKGTFVEYDALSYVWGSRTGTEALTCDGRILLVTPNCQSALRHLRLADDSRNLWVDAICIDQDEAKDSVKERNSQVTLMGEIYAKGRSTICWLGDGNEFTGELLQLLKQIGACPTQRGRKKLLLFDERLRQDRKLDLDSSSLDFVLTHPWHCRIWTVQEAVFSQNCSIMCGHTLVLWDDYSSAIRFLVFENPTAETSSQADNSLVAIDLRNVLRDFVREQPPPKQASYSEENEDELDRCVVFLSSCLTSLNQLQATEAKDKIYGLHAIYTALGIPLPVVDYGQSLARVYEGAAVAMISWSGKLRILGDACRTDHDISFPSWVPDWSDNELKISVPARRTPVGSPIRNLSPASLNPVPGELHLRGRIVAIVESWEDHHVMAATFPSRPDQCMSLSFSEEASDPVGDAEFMRLWIQMTKYFRQLHHILRTNGAYCGNYDLEDILCDMLNQASCSEPNKVFRAWLDILQYPNTTYDLTAGKDLVNTWKPQTARGTSPWSAETTNCAVIAASLVTNRIQHQNSKFDGSPAILDMISEFAIALANKSLVRVNCSENGKIALGTGICTTAADDVVVLLEGAEWPVILRQMGSAWRYIGPTFIIGMMDEETNSGGDGFRKHNIPLVLV